MAGVGVAVGGGLLSSNLLSSLLQTRNQVSSAHLLLQWGALLGHLSPHPLHVELCPRSRVLCQPGQVGSVSTSGSLCPWGPVAGDLDRDAHVGPWVLRAAPAENLYYGCFLL